MKIICYIITQFDEKNMKKLGCMADNTQKARSVLSEITSKYDIVNVELNPELSIDVLIVLGGDGFMLHNIHKFMDQNIPIYGINCGSVGFLLNNYDPDSDLAEIINEAYVAHLVPLTVKATDCCGATYESIAVNEVSIFRATYQSTFLRVKINGVEHLKKLVSDGLLISTPAGSSAYNFSAGGPIIPINSNLTVLTGINVFRPRRWKSVLLPSNISISVEILEPEKRPVIVAADYNELHDIELIQLCSEVRNTVKLLFNSQHSLEEKIISEQFLY